MNGFPSGPSLLANQTRYQFLTFTRSPVGMFFTLGLPTIMLVLFNSLFGDGTVDTPDGSWSVQQFYTGGLAAFTAVSATYTNLVNVVPIRRDEGILKRWRSTPVPTGAYLGGWVLSALAIAVLGVALQLAIGVVVLRSVDRGQQAPRHAPHVRGRRRGVRHDRTRRCGPRPERRFGTGRCERDDPPARVRVRCVHPARGPAAVARSSWETSFPSSRSSNAFQDTLNPFVEAPGFSWGRLGYVAAWGVAGALLAMKTFTWEPSSHGPSRRSRRRATLLRPACSRRWLRRLLR